MTGRRGLGRRFGWLWAAYAVSAYGTGLGFGAFPLIAVLVLHSGPAQVSALSAAGLAVGAVAAVPLGPWVEFHRKRPVMMAMDLTRFAALVSVPAAYALGVLSFAQLLVVSVVAAAAKIAFNAASGAFVKALVRPEDLLIANSRFESTMWAATVVGPPLGGAAIAMFGPVTTVLADAVSYLLSALGIRAIGGTEPHPTQADTTHDTTTRSRPEPCPTQDTEPRWRADEPPPTPDSEPRPTRADTTHTTHGATTHDATTRRRPGEPRPARVGEPPWHAAGPRWRADDLLDGWRLILTHHPLRRLFFNTILVNGLIMVGEPLLAVLLLGQLGFAPWQYGLVFAAPCIGGLIGARLARRLVARYGQHKVILTSGVLRACWPIGLAFVQPGLSGIVLVIAVQFGLVFCCAVYNPVLATYRLEHASPGRIARMLSAWSISSSLTIAALTALWGLLAAATSPRAAIAIAGALMLATPLLLPFRSRPAAILSVGADSVGGVEGSRDAARVEHGPLPGHRP